MAVHAFFMPLRHQFMRIDDRAVLDLCHCQTNPKAASVSIWVTQNGNPQ